MPLSPDPVLAGPAALLGSSCRECGERIGRAQATNCDMSQDVVICRYSAESGETGRDRWRLTTGALRALQPDRRQALHDRRRRRLHVAPRRPLSCSALVAWKCPATRPNPRRWTVALCPQPLPRGGLQVTLKSADGPTPAHQRRGQTTRSTRTLLLEANGDRRSRLEREFVQRNCSGRIATCHIPQPASDVHEIHDPPSPGWQHRDYHRSRLSSLNS
jgi:hypothetical protein